MWEEATTSLRKHANIWTASLQLKPKIEIILNIDSDHLDYFKDVEHIAESFDRFAKARACRRRGHRSVRRQSICKSGQLIGLTECSYFRISAKAATYYATDISFRQSSGRPAFTVKLRRGGSRQNTAYGAGRAQYSERACRLFACCHNLGVGM